MLARQTGFGQAHISNFLRRKRVLSLEGLDRVLQSQLLTIADLMPDQFLLARRAACAETNYDAVPLVSSTTALTSQIVPPHSVLDVLNIPSGILQSFRSRRANSRKGWLRFVAIRLSSLQASPMEPVLTSESIAVIDRHYNSLLRYHPARPTLYAVQYANSLVIRYLEFESNRLVLRPHSPAYPVVLVELGANETPSDHVIGRVCFLLSQL
ncbi:MAG TPA: hypothetical protein VM554_10445 [Acidisarcina sp.]|nr:hypothetical protein [Acidisarcina sp.]